MEDINPIRTKRLLIRRLEMTDKEALFAYRSLPEVARYQTWKPKQISEVETFIKKSLAVVPHVPDAWLQLAICLKDGPLIGDIGIHFLETADQVEIGYTLSPSFQGRGLALEAVRNVVSFVFAKWKKHRIIASVDPSNRPSVRLLENLSFRKEAHFVKSLKIDGQWQDDCIYAMLDDQWV